MNLELLTKTELNERFLKVHNEYLTSASRPISEIEADAGFKALRNKLRLLLNEFRGRRESASNK